MRLVALYGIGPAASTIADSKVGAASRTTSALCTLYESNLGAGHAFCDNRCVDWELLLPIGFVLLASLGLVCGGAAGYHYIRWERSSDTPSVLVAIVHLQCTTASSSS